MGGGHASGGVQIWVSAWTRGVAALQMQRPPGGADCTGKKGPQCLAEMRPPHVSLELGEAQPDPAVLSPCGPQVPRVPSRCCFCERCSHMPASPSPRSCHGPHTGRTKPPLRPLLPGRSSHTWTSSRSLFGGFSYGLSLSEAEPHGV